MIAGVITDKDVLRNFGSIVRNFGVRPYLRCLLAIVCRRRATFLELMWETT